MERNLKMLVGFAAMSLPAAALAQQPPTDGQSKAEAATYATKDAKTKDAKTKGAKTKADAATDATTEAQADAATPAQPATAAPARPETASEAKPADAATAATTESQSAASTGAVKAATKTDVKVGASVHDSAGAVIGKVESVDAKGAVLSTGDARAQIPLSSIGMGEKGLMIAMTRSQFEAAAKARKPK